MRSRFFSPMANQAAQEALACRVSKAASEVDYAAHTVDIPPDVREMLAQIHDALEEIADCVRTGKKLKNEPATASSATQ